VTAQFALHTHVMNLKLRDSGDVERYLAEFNIAREKFTSMGVPYTDQDAIHQLLLGIPDSGTWSVFKQVTLTADVFARYEFTEKQCEMMDNFKSRKLRPQKLLSCSNELWVTWRLRACVFTLSRNNRDLVQSMSKLRGK
jgi:hypothetical protein